MSVVKVALKDGRTICYETIDLIDTFDDVLIGYSVDHRIVMRHKIQDIGGVEIDPAIRG